MLKMTTIISGCHLDNAVIRTPLGQALSSTPDRRPVIEYAHILRAGIVNELL